MRPSGRSAPARLPLTSSIRHHAPVAAPTIEFATCTTRDLPHLYDLATRTFAVLPGWSRRRVIEMLIVDVVFVAREEGCLAGYVALQVGAVEVLLEQLVVATGHERFELGDGLVAQAKRFGLAENLRSLYVEAREGDWTVRSFYERCGFVPVGGDLLELVLPGPGEA